MSHANNQNRYRITVGKNQKAQPPAIPETKSEEKKDVKDVISITKAIERDFSVLPDHFKTKRFNYHFHDSVKHAKIDGPVRLIHEDHHLRLKVAATPLTSVKHAKKLSSNPTFPPSFSLRKNVEKILNQGDIGACVSHSAAQGLHIVMDRKDASRSMFSRLAYSASKFWPSRLYIYDNARRIDGTPLSDDVGTTNISACLALDQYKVCPEEMWPYSRENLSRSPPHMVYVAADKYKLFEYSHVDNDIESFKLMLTSGFPIMIGIVVFPSMIHSGLNGGSGTVPMPDESREAPIGGHSLLVVGYDDEKKQLEFVNHWGSEWGSNGCGTLPYDFIFNEKYGGDFMAIESFS